MLEVTFFNLCFKSYFISKTDVFALIIILGFYNLYIQLYIQFNLLFVKF